MLKTRTVLLMHIAMSQIPEPLMVVVTVNAMKVLSLTQMAFVKPLLAQHAKILPTVTPLQGWSV